MFKLLSSGSWLLSSESDPRWNCWGSCEFCGGFQMPRECEEKIEELKKVLGELPEDLAMFGWLWKRGGVVESKDYAQECIDKLVAFRELWVGQEIRILMSRDTIYKLDWDYRMIWKDEFLGCKIIEVGVEGLYFEPVINREHWRVYV